MDLSTRNLEQALSIRRQIDALERRLKGLVGGAGGGAAAPASRGRGGKRRLAGSARPKMAAAASAPLGRFCGARLSWSRRRTHIVCIRPRQNRGGSARTLGPVSCRQKRWRWQNGWWQTSWWRNYRGWSPSPFAIDESALGSPAKRKAKIDWWGRLI